MNLWTSLAFSVGCSTRAIHMSGLGLLLRRARWMACTAAILFSMPPAGAADGENLKLVLIDAGTNRAIARQAVMLWGDAEVRCFRAPCPMVVGILWKGTTSSRGVVIIPRKAVKRQAAVEVPGYVRQSLGADAPGAELRILMAKVPPQP